jgi:hypothetical protein
MICDQLAQPFQAEVGEGYRLLVGGAVDPSYQTDAGRV